jgi:hypothetical protein
VTSASQTRRAIIETLVVAGLFLVSYAAASFAMRTFRAAGHQPSFYQSNFEPAVMMACGRGFGTAAAAPPELSAFLNVRQNEFDCAVLPANLQRLPVTGPGNANWYYLYGATAFVWRLTGISWTALDGLVSVFSGITTVLLYGIFRLVSHRMVAAAVALLLTVSPANLTPLLSLRDFSKAPFVLAAILILAVLVWRPQRPAWTFAFAALYGGVVGLGWGFRTDVGVMVPFGALVVMVFLPGSFKAHGVRNLLATAALLASFAIVAAPVIAGQKLGGCQFHFALLGLTTPMTRELNLTPSIYRFGDSLLDTFVDLKAGDYAERVLSLPLPSLCSPDYDTASGGVFRHMAVTFPADLVVRAYGSVLTVLRGGLEIPAIGVNAPAASRGLVASIYAATSRVSSTVAPAGPLLVLAAIGLAWAQSVRVGLALTVFVLFLTGYPAIQFQERHWFHLRFIPWWAGVLVAGQLLQHGIRGWPAPAKRRATIGVAGLVVGLIAALSAVRVAQAGTVAALIAEYEAAATEPLPIARDAGSFLPVDWQPHDYAPPPAHRGSDLLVATLDAQQCAGPALSPLAVKVRYQADVVSHDMSTSIAVDRPAPGAAPSRLFIPVFWAGLDTQTYLRFAGLEVVGAPATCIAQVSRFAERSSVPLWIQVQVPADWRQHSLYQSIRAPRLIRWLTEGPSL